MLDRRNFLLSSAGLATLAALPFQLFGDQYSHDVPALPDPAKFSGHEEAYWAELRRQFLIPADEIYLNNGTVGSSPMPILKAVMDGYHSCERMDQADPEDYPIWGYGPWNEFRDPVAQFIGVTRDELALVRNSTEANNFMANGLDLKPGDEVLMSDQEHPSGDNPWLMRQKRYGIVVKKYEIPKPPKNPADILNRINDAITPRTRVLFTSHITTTTGVVQPVKEMCSLARSKGIISMLDGAHVIGAMKLNVKDIGPDMYSSSPHKWLQAPKGTGFLYIRDEIMDRVWSTVTTAGWDDTKMRAQRFQMFGSSNVPTLYGLRAAIEMANEIGMDRIEQRHRMLCDYLLGEMVKRGAESWTSPDPAMRCAISSVNVPPYHIHELETAMWKQHKIRIRGGEPYKIRLSTPYYLQKADLDRFLEKYDEYKKQHA